MARSNGPHTNCSTPCNLSEPLAYVFDHPLTGPLDGGFVCRQLVHRRGAAFLEARNSQQRYEATPADEIEIWGVVRTGVRDYRR